MLGPSEAEAVRRLAAELSRAGQEWERKAASATGGVPIYRSWTGVLVIRDDGVVVSVVEDTGAVEEVREAEWIRVACVEAARKHAALKALVPPRPEGTPDCVACSGRGWVQFEGFTCGDCCGAGWRAWGGMGDTGTT